MPNIESVKAVINGTTYDLTYNSSTGQYTAQGVAPSASSSIQTGGYYPVTVTAEYDTGTTTTVNDQTAGAIGTGCRFVVKEKVVPKVIFNYPTNGTRITSLAGQYITIKVSDNENGQNTGYSGVKLSTFYCKIDGATTLTESDFTKTPITTSGRTSGYTLNYTPSSSLGDGSHTLTAYIEDVDGNKSAVASVSFIIDTIAPSLSVSYPTEGFAVATDTITITGTTEEEISTPVTVAIYLNDVFKGNATVSGTGFSYELTFDSEGNQKIEVVATDDADLSTSVTINGYYSSAAPVISSVAIEPNPADAGATYIIKVVVS